MLHFISWHQYFVFLLIALVIYYLGIWVIYFKARIPSFADFRQKSGQSFAGDERANEETSPLQEAIESIRPSFRKGLHKDELVFALQQQLKPYQQNNEAGFRQTINGFITESADKCSIHLSEEDLRVLWI